MDFDDAIFHNYDQHRFTLVRKVFGRRLDKLMASAALVVCGNHYLAQRACDARSSWIEIVPTVIDLLRYPYPSNSSILKLKPDYIPRIVWIGSPSTMRYLQILRKPLLELASHNKFIFRVVGSCEFNLPGVATEFLPWTENTEVADINTCDIGVMPLLDSPFEKGKCGYKLIQYMACGLPVVASPIGVNKQIVQPGVNGLLAYTSEEWVTALSNMLQNKTYRLKMGLAGRHQIEQSYCIQRTGPKLVKNCSIL